MKKAERIFIIIVMFFSFAVIYEGTKIPIISKYSIGPGFLPIFVGVSSVVVTGALLIFSYINPDNENDTKKFMTKEGFIRLSTFVVILMSALLSHNFIGLIVPLTIFMVIIFRYVEKYEWIASIKVAIICNGVFYLIFKVWLGVPLPGINL